MKFKLDKFLLISIIILCLCLVYGVILYSLPPEKMEKYYVTTVYSSIRYIWGNLSFFSVFPLSYYWILFQLIFILILIYLHVFGDLSFWKGFQKCLGLLILHLSFFYYLWGFNYLRVPLNERLSLDHEIERKDFEREIDIKTQDLCQLRAGLETDSMFLDFQAVEEHLRSLVKSTFKELLVVGLDRVRVRVLHPEGCLLVFGTAGIYWPFSGEGYVDAGLDSLIIPFTMAHELAHGFGWTDEGECNFVALLACRKSNSKMIRYSAELSYWKYLMNNASRLDPKLFHRYSEEITNSIKFDLKSIDSHADKFPEILPALRDWLYDTYLKLNGVEGGSNSYSGMVKWVINYQNKGNSK